MIIEENEFRVAYKNLHSLVSDVRICVGKPIEYPAEEVTLIAYLKEKLLEYDKYWETMQYLLNKMKETNKAFKRGIMIEKQLLPNKHKVIEEKAQVMLNECPYLDLIGEVGHLYSALKLLRNEVSSKLETRKMVSSEQNREPIMDKILKNEDTSKPKQIDSESAPDYFTSNEESDSSIRRRITRKPEERTIKFHRNVNKTLKNQTRRDIKESGNTDLAIKGTWNIEDLIKLVTTLTKNNNEGNRARFIEIKIPIYNGDKHKYEEFWAVFHQMVHSNISFSPIEKFLYLTNSLTDKAAEAIRGTRIIVENYQQAIDIIKEKFGNRQDNEACIAKQLKNLEPASKSIRNCCQVFNKIQSLIQQLKAVGRDISKDSDPLWKEIIYDKFPNHIREKVYMAMKRDKETKWTINKMISYIDDLIAARETYEVGEDAHSEAESNKKPYQNDTKRMAYKSNPITSRFCQQGHKDDERKTHRTPEERRNSLRNRMICWKCFSTYHTSWKCTRPNCSQCGKEHHRLLCLGNSPELPNTTHNRETSPSSNNGVYVDFDCPVFPLASLHKRYETTLPITMPRLRLYTENSELIAETEQMEATIAISSFMNVQLSVLVDSPPCSISLSPIQGCYRCLEGAEIIASCKSDKSAIVELRCADKSFAIQCDPSPKKQILKFHYNSAIILDTCESSCGNKNVSLVVEGILKFHSENVEELRKLQVIHQWHTSEGKPDLNPLLITLREHWKFTLAAAISTAALIAGTYFWGPIVVIFLINAIFLIIGKIGTILKTLVCCFKRK